MVRHTVPSLMLSVTALVATAYSGSPEDWAQYNYDNRGWRFNRAEETLSPETVPRLAVKWRFPEEGSELVTPGTHFFRLGAWRGGGDVYIHPLIRLPLASGSGPMARMPRNEVFSPDEVAIVHVVNRVVRGCFLLGDDRFG